MNRNIFRFLFSAVLMMCCMNVWAETKTVSYLYPVYNIDGEHTSGIKEWQTGTVDATVITNNTNKTTTLDAGWYVVTGDNVSTGELMCDGRVHLILADGAKLTATGQGNRAGILTLNDTLTIYGQSAQSGQLIANGGEGAAGIGGRDGFTSLEIFINGGMITANGGKNAAGIGTGSGLLFPNMAPNRTIIINGGTVTAKGGENAAGIGGGNKVDGEYIVINGGMVTAYGDNGGAGIGGGYEGSSYGITINDGTVIANGGMMIDGKTSFVEGIGSGIGGGYKGSTRVIYVAAALLLYADNSNPPSSQIKHTYGQDIAGNLAGKRYALVCSNDGLIIVNNILIKCTTKWMPSVTIPASVTSIRDGAFRECSGIKSVTLNWTEADKIVPITNADLQLQTGSTLLVPAGTEDLYAANESWSGFKDYMKPYITANQDPNNKNYYATFYSSSKAYKLSKDVTAYTAEVDGSLLKLKPIADGIIPANEGVVLKLTSTDDTAAKVHFLVEEATSEGTKDTGNALTGTDTAISSAPAGTKAFSLGESGVGFYLWDGKPIGAHKAYIPAATQQ